MNSTINWLKLAGNFILNVILEVLGALVVLCIIVFLLTMICDIFDHGFAVYVINLISSQLR